MDQRTDELLQALAREGVEFVVVGGVVECRVLSLDDLIAVKHHVGRPKDKAVEIELRAIRERLKGT